MNLSIIYSKLDKQQTNLIKSNILKVKSSWKKELRYVNSMSSGFWPEYDWFKKLNNQLLNEVNNLTNKPHKVSCYWANYYKKGHSATIHNHSCEKISAIVIIKASKSNPLQFVIGKNKYRIHEQDGLVLYFDSRINHEVLKCDESRITLAVDFIDEV